MGCIRKVFKIKVKVFKSNSYLDERRYAPFIDKCGAKHPAFSVNGNVKNLTSILRRVPSTSLRGLPLHPERSLSEVEAT